MVEALEQVTVGVQWKSQEHQLEDDAPCRS